MSFIPFYCSSESEQFLYFFFFFQVSGKLEVLGPEGGGSYLDPGDHKPLQRAWLTSRPQKGAPEKRGHYRDQHQPEDLDPDLLMVEDHENSTQTVVILRRSFLSTHSPLHFIPRMDLFSSHVFFIVSFLARMSITPTTSLKSTVVATELVESCGWTWVRWERSGRSGASCPALTGRLR